MATKTQKLIETFSMNGEIKICGINVSPNELITGRILSEIVSNLLNEVTLCKSTPIEKSSEIFPNEMVIEKTQSIEDKKIIKKEKKEPILPIEKFDNPRTSPLYAFPKANLTTSYTLLGRNYSKTEISPSSPIQHLNTSSPNSDTVMPKENDVETVKKEETITQEIKESEKEEVFAEELQYIKESMDFFKKWTDMNHCRILFDSKIEYDPDEYDIITFNKIVLNKPNLLFLYVIDQKYHIAGVYVKEPLTTIGTNTLTEDSFPFSIKCSNKSTQTKKFVRVKQVTSPSPMQLVLTTEDKIDYKSRPYFYIYESKFAHLKIGLGSSFSNLSDEFVDIRGNVNCCSAMGGVSFYVERIVVVQLY